MEGGEGVLFRHSSGAAPSVPSFCLPWCLYLFTFPPTVQEWSLFSTPSPGFTLDGLFDDGHSDPCEVISHCSFDLHFSNNQQCWPSFHVFIGQSVCLPCRNVLFMPIFWLGFLFFWYWAVWTAYILEGNPLSVASFAIIFSHSESCLFSLFIVSFAAPELLNLIRSHLFIFAFISITLGGGS